MHIVALAWIFVVVLKAAAEASAPQGSLLAALFMLLLEGLLPLAIVLYVLNTPARKRRLQQQAQAVEQAQASSPAAADDAASSEASAVAGASGERGATRAISSTAAIDGDGGGHAAGAPVAPEREKT